MRKTFFYPKVLEIPEVRRSKIIRVGVIPYVKHYPSDVISFALGVDARHKELTDCGGVRDAEESIEMTAARELFEESACIFDFRKKLGRLTQSPVIVSRKSAIIFLDVSYCPYAFGHPYFLPRLFQRNMSILKSAFDHVGVRSPASVYFENESLLWIRGDDMNDLVNAVVSTPSVLRHSIRGISRNPMLPIFFYPPIYSYTKQTLLAGWKEALTYIMGACVPPKVKVL